MKIDKRKKYFIVLDVETTNNNMEDKNAPNDGLVYDLGFAIYDKKGVCYAERSFVIKEIFEDIDLMNTAYYKEKLPKYYKEIEEGKREVLTICQARKRIKSAIDYFNIKEVWAYNASFDYRTLNNTIRLVTGSFVRWFLPYGVNVFDIWHVACQVLGTQKTFLKENIRNDNGKNLKTSAERMFQYITQNEIFEEEHTGLEDTKIEAQILVRCLKSHKSIDKKINRLCWRIPQKAYKELCL